MSNATPAPAPPDAAVHGLPTSDPASLERPTIFAKATVERQKAGNRASTIGYYDIEKNIGEGNFAKVKLGVHSLTGEKVAIKVIDKSKLDKATVAKLFREVRIMKLLNHPHIVKLFEVIDTPKELFLILEYVPGGEIFDFLVARGRMKERDARKYFRQIISAVDYCHHLKIVHRDLKAENLLLDQDLNVKIADFGFSNQFSPGQRLNTWCGSPPYAAPELFQGKEYSGPEVDIWSLGVVLYVLICGALPFDGSNLQKLRARVLTGKFKVPFYMSTDCERLIKKMLILDPARRASMKDVKEDKWFNDECDVPMPAMFDSPSFQLNEEDHRSVLKACSEIGLDLEALDRALRENTYDSLAATYNLLAHRLHQKKVVAEQKAEAERKPTAETERKPPGDSRLEHSLTEPRKRSLTNPPDTAGKPTAEGSAPSKPAEPRPHIADPRSLRFSFSVSTTSTQPPAEMLAEVLRVIQEKGLKCENRGFLLECSSEGVELEVEICKLPRLSVNGVRFKRLGGDTWAYKALCEDLVSKLKF